MVALGDTTTGLRAREGAPWYGLKQGASHALKEGEQICLDFKDQVRSYNQHIGLVKKSPS